MNIQTKIVHKTLHRKSKIEQHEPNLKTDVSSGRVSSSCSTSSSCRVKHEVISHEKGKNDGIVSTTN